MESCLYEGVVFHERLQPVIHRFHYRLYLNFLDLTEVPILSRAGLLSGSQFAPGSFLRRDHFGDPRQPLERSVRDLVAEHTGIAVDGPIRLLTQLRNFGYYFSPLNLFFCYASDGCHLQAIVAEVQNTPWLERHRYVLWQGNQDNSEGHLLYRHPKSFHVSPYMGMDVEYRWRLSLPDEYLNVGIENRMADNLLFRATLNLRRVPLSHRTRFTMLCRYPLMTARITIAIYLQAFQLWRKKCPFHAHPRHHAEIVSLATKGKPNVLDGSPVSAGTN